ncbi:MAG: hypothetical protein ACPLQP_08710 [Moorellaceae bacterium]
MKKLLGTIRERAYSALLVFLHEEKGSMDQLIWVIGSAVVVVLVIVVFMALAPSTAQSIWQRFINWATGKFGI